MGSERKSGVRKDPEVVDSSTQKDEVSFTEMERRFGENTRSSVLDVINLGSLSNIHMEKSRNPLAVQVRCSREVSSVELEM